VKTVVCPPLSYLPLGSDQELFQGKLYCSFKSSQSLLHTSFFRKPAKPSAKFMIQFGFHPPKSRLNSAQGALDKALTLMSPVRTHPTPNPVVLYSNATKRFCSLVNKAGVCMAARNIESKFITNKFPHEGERRPRQGLTDNSLSERH
jgi:hypothetical protein